MPADALLIAMYGSIGKLGLTTEPVTTNQAIAFCIPDTIHVNLRYLFYFLLFRRYHLLSLGQGGTQQNISQTILLDEPIALPKVDEQTRIVARIDELFAEVDDGEAALTRARDDLATWRKALLKAAVTGELTADWRAANLPAESGANLSVRILADRASVAATRLGKRRDKAPEDVTPSQQRLMWAAPDGWTWMQLGTFSFVTKLAGFEYTKFVQYDDDGDLRVIKAENAGLQGFKKTQYSRIKSSSVTELTRSRLHGGELLMVFVGAGTGNVAIVPDGEEFFLGPNIGMMRVETDIVSPRYVELFLRSPVGKALATAAMKAVAQPSLSMGTIRQIPILLPPAAEQEEILRRLEHALLATTDCVTDIRDQQTYAATLRQSILAAAFRGDLA
ncbi:hypothetical protein ASF09_02025 [Sphingomonas sp. Leaf242]|nr:hypothetical protein ASF09_02025 [Sphingomonas sp. Leaf242]